MLILTNTTDNLQVVLTGAVTTNQLNCLSSWRDVTVTTFTPGRTITNTNSTTDVNLVPAPAADTQRVIDFVSIYNADTVTSIVTVKYDANGTEYIIFKATIGAAEKIEYTDAKGWQVYNTLGAVKTSINQGSNSITSGLNNAVLASDVTNNNAIANSIASVTGLEFPVTNGGKFYFQFVINYTSASTNTGSRWTILGPGGTMRYRSQYSLTTTSHTINEGLTAHDTPAASNATSAATGANIAIIEGIYEASADGTVIARFASEVANSAIVAKAGSLVWYTQVA